MDGLILAFKSYKANLGIWISPFMGLANFKRLFSNPKFFTALKITLKINVGRLLITFPFSIILALLINEVRIGKGKKVYQWIFTFPHFLSWVVIASIATNVLSYDGMVNSIIKMLGGNYQKFRNSCKQLYEFKEKYSTNESVVPGIDWDVTSTAHLQRTL